ncbi:MAG: ATP-binding protein [Candidatus Dadabacteria bacterium]|nr:ATP-binding protein [Candidatus Dadabacteria bacterium]MDE0477933.1 ATP-binding protein [Candidatus Dadabacteria bacterium]
MDKVKGNLRDLIEFPMETLENEYKGWVDLDDKVTQAKIARHLVALTNHGGGHLVFGFRDDLSPDPNHPPSIAKYNRDTFTGIVKHYLSPDFQCDVHVIPNKNGEKFPVIRVGGHGQVPVITKAGGPQDEKGRPQGIAARTLYIRKPGPESAPISEPKEWGELIRRCTLNDREKLLGDIARLFDTQKEATPAVSQQLENWHHEVEKRFLHLLSQARHLRWPLQFCDNRYQLSYLISFNAEQPPLQSLHQILTELNNEVLNTVKTGWSMFYPLSAPEVRPRDFPEREDGTGQTVLESNIMDARLEPWSGLWTPEFWRVAPDGRASLVRAYREDRPRSTEILGRRAGTWLSRETVIRETAELVTHAKCMAKRFETAAQVSFRCTWMGLENRELAEFDPSVDYFRSHKSQTDKRITEKTCTIVELEARWSTIVSDLSKPVLRLFGSNYCSPEIVEHMKPEFIKL